MDIVLGITRLHRSQNRDMSMIRGARWLWGTAYVREVDPYGAEGAALVRE